jgi:hypothetical protein
MHAYVRMPPLAACRLPQPATRPCGASGEAADRATVQYAALEPRLYPALCCVCMPTRRARGAPSSVVVSEQTQASAASNSPHCPRLRSRLPTFRMVVLLGARFGYTNVANLPNSRNPSAYCAPGTKIPSPVPPPSNFSDQGVGRAALIIIRPPSAVVSRNEPPKYPLKLLGVAPADQVPVREIGTRPSTTRDNLRAYVSNRSGVIMYQNQLNGSQKYGVHRQ